MKRWPYLVLIGVGIVAFMSLGRQLLVSPEQEGQLSAIRSQRAVAFTFGKLIRDSLPGSGEILVVQLPSVDGGQEARKQVIKALAEGLGNSSSRIVDVSPQRLPPPELYALMRAQSDGKWGEQFLQWVDGHPRPRAIVSFMGLPSDVPAEKIRALAPLLAIGSTGKLSVEQWLTNHRAFAWVLLRSDFSGPPQSGSLEKIFKTQYELRLANR